MQKLVSFFQILKIEIDRWTDHLWRNLTGLPQLKRSMITPQLFLGGQYKVSRIIRSANKITAIVNMRTRSLKDPSILKQIKLLHLPTKDWHAPTIEDLNKGVKFIQKEIEADGKVYIHCFHGEGRGPTMVAAYLISTGMTLEDAISLIKKVRTFIRPNKEQLAQLSKFEQLVAKKKTLSS